jgi:dTDP-4-dehydrorhamnose 3,5-epimerase
MLSSQKDRQSVTADWATVAPTIDGVGVFEMKNVLSTDGRLTEMFRPEWEPSGLPIAHVFQVLIHPRNTPNWNCHKVLLDRLFFGLGHIKLVLFDGREASPSYRRINEFHFGESRPALVTVPPGVWHALQCRGTSGALVVNLGTHPYDYEDPDHYRLPADTTEIPYVWRP